MRIPNTDLRMAIIASMAALLLAVKLWAVQPMPGGVQVRWQQSQGEINYAVWMRVLPDTNWVLLGNSVATTFTYTNPVPPNVMIGVTALKFTNGVCCAAEDVGIAHWPPDIATPAKTVTLTPVGGYTVETGKWVKVSYDLFSWEDLIRMQIKGTNILLEHKASPVRPHLFIEYPTAVSAPMPGGVK